MNKIHFNENKDKGLSNEEIIKNFFAEVFNDGLLDSLNESKLSEEEKEEHIKSVIQNKLEWDRN